MRVLIVAMASVFALTVSRAPAWAQNYPWCAVYSTGDGDATNCGFVSREQCQATVSGVGGRCERNSLYVAEPSAPPAAAPAGKPASRR